MDKQQLEKLFDDYFGCNLQRSKTITTMDEVNVKRFIFDTIIPNVLNSLMIKERAKVQDEDLQAHMDSTYYIFNKYIRDRSKELYGINIQPFTFIPSQTTKGKSQQSKTLTCQTTN